LAAANIQRLSTEVLLPRVWTNVWVCGESRELIKPLFRSYLFAKFSVVSHLARIQFARGVRRVLSADGTPIPVDEMIVESIRSRMGVDGLVRLEEEDWKTGTRFAIQSGPLRGLAGLFERELEDGQRVQLLVESIQYSAHVVVEKRHLSVAV
jgi:transcription antitermination factor NusG